MEPVLIQRPRGSENERVLDWRFDALEEAGFNPVAALVLAESERRPSRRSESARQRLPARHSAPHPSLVARRSSPSWPRSGRTLHRRGLDPVKVLSVS